VGDEVLLLDNKIKAKSEKVLTHRPYSGPYYISQLVKGKDDVGLAYRLINKQTGKTFKYLVPSDRLKKIHKRSESWVKSSYGQTGPTLSPASTEDGVGDKVNNAQVAAKQKADNHESNGFEPEVKILKQKKKGKK